MYGDFILIEEPGGSIQRARRLELGDTSGRNEAWLRDQLAQAPEIIPIVDIDPSYGPLVPLCRELRTEAGPIDLAFVNPAGLLTIVECKLWRNPEARRKVIAQVLDYARAIARWTYSDLQREVARATGKSGNVPFSLVQELRPDLEEHNFVDAVSRSMRSGRFLLLVAGDGIREDLGAITDLINRNAALGFSVALLEVALYKFGQHIAVQPRVLARTLTIERAVIVLREEGKLITIEDAEDSPVSERPRAALNAQMRSWWQPLDGLEFDDPDQEPAKYAYPNLIYTPLPWPGTWVNAYRSKDKGGTCGVFLGGRQAKLRYLTQQLIANGVLDDLPEGAIEVEDGLGILIWRRESEFASTEQQHQWLAKTMNAFINAIRPRLKKIESVNYT